MKLKNVNFAFLVLGILLFSSFSFYVAAQQNSTSQNNVFLDSDQDGLTNAEEKLYGTDPYNPDTDGDGYSDGAEVKAGYDPLKPAPGDKLSDEASTQKTPSSQNTTTADDKSATDKSADSSASTNMTEELYKKVAALTNDKSSDSQVSMDQISQVTNELLSTQNATVALPQIDTSKFKIKKQDYPKSQAEEMKKEDFINYISTILYIMASNSPIPITSSTDASSAMTQTIQKVMLSLSTQDPSSLDSLSKSGQAMLEQFQAVEVPEDLVDMHVKVLQYATYAQNLKSLIKFNPNDPLSNIINYSKIATFVQSLANFTDSTQSETEKYDVSYSDIQNKVKSMGADIPNLEDFINMSNSLNSN